MRDQKADWKVTGDRDSDICFKTPWQCPKAFSLWLIRFPEGTLDLLCRRKSGQGLTVSLLIPLTLNTDPYSCPHGCSVFSCAEPPR